MNILTKYYDFIKENVETTKVEVDGNYLYHLYYEDGRNHNETSRYLKNLLKDKDVSLA
jgi:DUF971 family protein